MKSDRAYFLVLFLAGIAFGFFESGWALVIVGTVVLIANAWREFRSGTLPFWTEPIGKIGMVLSQEFVWFIGAMLGTLMNFLS